MHRLLTITVSLMIPFHAWAAYDVGLAVIHLEKIATALAEVRRGVHVHDEPTILVMEKLAGELVSRLRSEPLSRECFELQRELIVTFQFRRAYFDFIRTRRNGATLDRIVSTVSVFRDGVGFKRAPSEMVHANLARLHGALKRLLEDELSARGPEAKIVKDLRMVTERMPRALAAAKASGDCPSVYEEVRHLHPQVRKLYDNLQLYASAPRDALMTEIIGYNELLGELAEVRLREKGNGGSP